MLVIGRKSGEYVVIGEDVFVKVIRGEKGDIRLAIDAPQHVRITRGEVYERELSESQPKPFQTREASR